MTVDQSYYTKSFEEWKETKLYIEKNEGYLDGLRRYGFTFVAALLAVNSIQVYIDFSNITKVFLSVTTIAFIVGLYFLDVYYQRKVEAASIRARVLETVVLSDIELNCTLYNRFMKENLHEYITRTYIGFIIVAVIIGVTVIVAAPDAPLNTLIYSSTESTTLAISSTESITLVNSSTLSTSSANSSTPTIPPIDFLKFALFLDLLVVLACLPVILAWYEDKKTNPSWQTVIESFVITRLIIAYGISLTIMYRILQDSYSLEFLLSNISLLIFFALFLSLLIILAMYVDTKSNPGQRHRSKNDREQTSGGPDLLTKCSKPMWQTILVGSLIITFLSGAYVICQDSIGLEFPLKNVILLILAGGTGTFLINYFSNNVVLTHLHGEEDWIIDKYSCEQGEEVRITITNLGGEQITYQKDEKICVIYLEGNEPPACDKTSGNESDDKQNNKKISIGLTTEGKEITIPIHGNYSLIWNTTNFQKGIYRIKPCRWEGDTLIRSVFVHEKTENRVEPCRWD